MIHIACCFDQNYELPFIVLANSIARTSRSPVTLHAFHHGPLRFARAKIRRSTRFTVEFRDITGRYDHFSVRGPMSKVTYARFDLPDLLPDVGRILYLDSDMLVRRDLRDLFDTPLGDKPLAAGLDYPLIAHSLRGEPIVIDAETYDVARYVMDFVEVADVTRYFNAGVLLMDLNEFRSRNLVGRAREALATKLSRSIFNDQDALNHVIGNQFVALDPRWNASHELMMPQINGVVPREIRDAIALYDDPWIIHYAGLKPWRRNFISGPWEKYFWEEAARGSDVRWPLLRLFWASIPDLSRSEISRRLWEARNRSPRIGSGSILLAAVRHAGSTTAWRMRALFMSGRREQTSPAIGSLHLP
jgi:lipopolysaccharide biosynthesis glycosyltransferase